MGRRCGGAVLAAVVALPLLAAGQGTETTMPRTPWGHPDLQGVWDYSTITPMQRSKEFADRAYLTEEEAQRLERAAVEREIAADTAPRPELRAGADVGGHARAWGLDQGTKVVRDRRTSLIIDPPNGRFPDFTPAGAADAKARQPFGAILPADSYVDLGLGDRCLNTLGLPLVPLPYNSNVQIFQTPDTVALNIEQNHTWRIIPLDGRPHMNIPQWVGNSRGRWEGDTLVVETKNFKALLPMIRSGRNIRLLVERFTRVGDDAIRYEFTVDDPVRFVSPWTAALTLRRQEGQIYQVACHEGNYSIVNILTALRAVDGTPDAPPEKPGAIPYDFDTLH